MSPDSYTDVQTEIPVGNGPISALGVSPDGSRLIAANYGDDSLSVIDTDSRLVETLAGVQEPLALAVAEADRVYVSSVCSAYDSIEVVDASNGTVAATHSVALSISDLAVSADGRYVYAGRNGAAGSDVAVLDTTTDQVEVIDIAGAGSTTQCVRTSPDGARLYVATNGPGGGKLVVLGAPEDRPAGRARWRRKKAARPQSLSVISTVEIGLAVRDVAISPDGTVAYVASCCPELGAVLDVVNTGTNKVTSTRKLGEITGNLTGCTLSRDGRRAYLVSDEDITVLCTRTEDIIGTVEVTGQPSCAVESPDGKRLYVADYSGTVTVAPVASTAPLAIEGAAPRSHASADWVIPELLQYEPALALR